MWLCRYGLRTFTRSKDLTLLLSYQAKPTELKNTHGDSVKTPTYVDVELIAKNTG